MAGTAKVLMEEDDDDDDDIAACWEGVVARGGRGRGRGSGLGDGGQRQRRRYKVTRRYYTSQRRFEQSLDIYEPLPPLPLPLTDNGSNDSKDNNDNRGHHQIVVLVMGSGWLGHRSFVYGGTNWWNSSAPRSIVSLNQTAICIRHSGGFPIVGTPLRAILAFLIILWILYHQLLSIEGVQQEVLLSKSSSPSDLTARLLMIPTILVEQVDWYNVIWNASRSWTFYTVFTLVAYIFLHVQSSYGKVRPASIQQMVNDVSKALSYLDEHCAEGGGKLKSLQKYHRSSNGDSNNNNKQKKIPIIFGGYSSGGHVAATLLLSPSQSPLPKQKLLPQLQTNSVNVTKSNSNNANPVIEIPSKLQNIEIRHVLFLSGVLDVSDEDDVMTLVSLTALNEWPERIPSPLKVLQQRLHLMTKLQQQQQKQQRSEHFGNDDDDFMATLSSSSSSPSSSSSSIYYPILPPHTLIGCRYEVMGIPILGPSFCSQEYARTLRNISQTNDHRCLLLEGSTFASSVNHWTILDSNELHETLRTKVFEKYRKGS